MSYRDPYAAGGSSRYANNQTPYGAAAPQGYSDSQQRYQTYDNTGEEEYNPYTSNAQTYGSRQQYEEPDYGYNGQNQNHTSNDYPPMQRGGSQKSGTVLSKQSNRPSVVVSPVRKHYSGFEQGEFTPAVPKAFKEKSAKTLKEYRYDHQGNLWTKGGRGRCAGRVCCCTLMTAVVLIVGIILSLALWIRPPSIQIGQVQTMIVNGNAIQQTGDGIQINLGVDISVSNPNYFSVDFKKIEAEIFYPINETNVGGGSANNIIFKSNTQTNFTFPFQLNYKTSADPNGKIILDLANKCGVTTQGQKTNINVDYKITLGIRFALITISPVISNQFNFPCPLQASDISKFLGNLGS
ncbi:hypothetical protein CPC08DRAFT_815997 [Agrocybe pediades]|nr:hypothetical protein CPC08DRAFT_815997 [Agrocybe pediades]